MMMHAVQPFQRDFGSSTSSEDDREPQPSSVLRNLVVTGDWAGVLARVATHPSEARLFEGVERRTPLHWACEHDAPAVVISSLLKAFPEASALVGTCNMTPLHITCSSSHASVHVIRVLLELGLPSQTSMRDLDGDTPLHNACRAGAGIDVLEVLLMANPSVVNLRDFEGLTPLLRLWVRYFVILGNDVINGVSSSADLSGQLGEAWSKTELLLSCANHGSLSEYQQLRDNGQSSMGVLHAAASIDCPRAVVQIAARVFGEQLEERDAHGRTPLMRAAMAPIYKVRDLSDEGYLLEDHILGNNNESSDCSAGAEEIETSPSSGEQPSVIQILLEASQNGSCTASMMDLDGRLPIHLALAAAKRWNQGVSDLAEANPESLSTVDPLTGLYPFQQAACAGDDVATIFELLRRSPSIMSDVRGN